MDFDRVSSRSHSVKTSKTPEVSDRVTETVGKGAAKGATPDPGLGGNTPGANPGTTTDDDGKNGYSGVQESNVYPKSTVDETKEKAVGSITKMGISVLVNKGKAEPAQVQAFLDSYVAAFPGATAQVTEITFDQTQAAEMKKAAATAASSNQMQQMFSLLPVIALIIAAALVFKGLAKAAKSQNVLVTALPGGGMLSGLPLSSASGSGSGSSGGGGGGTGSSAAQANIPALGSHDPFEDEEETPEIRAIRERVNVPLEQIKRMAQDRPEAVAMLLKSWLLEERR
jgi:flagellar biosynthesis/type III secretory pathway M-ring protein FliF/YscJ